MNLKRMDEKVMGLETLVCVGYGLKIRRERENGSDIGVLW